VIEFIDQATQERFYNLPLDKQREWYVVAEFFQKHGKVVKILFVEETKDALEVSIRIDQQFHHTA